MREINTMVNSICYQTLRKMKDILDNEMMSDFECVEGMIVCLKIQGQAVRATTLDNKKHQVTNLAPSCKINAMRSGQQDVHIQKGEQSDH